MKGRENLTRAQKEKLKFDFNLDDAKIKGYVGYHNTVQGSEFNHVSIFVGPEYYLDANDQIDFDESSLTSSMGLSGFWSLKNIKDKKIKEERHEINKKIALNQLRVLLTRATSEVTIYFADKKLREYIKNYIK